MFNGTNLKSIRQQKNLSMQELSNRSGISISMISQIERQKADPTITTLYRLCQGLEITIGSLMDDVTAKKNIVRKNERKSIALSSGSSKVVYQLLTVSPHDNLEMLLIDLEPGQEDRQLITHPGEECGFVIEGELTVILDDEEFILEAGDSIHFKSTTPHRFINRTKQVTRSVWAMTPPNF